MTTKKAVGNTPELPPARKQSSRDKEIQIVSLKGDLQTLNRKYNGALHELQQLRREQDAFMSIASSEKTTHVIEPFRSHEKSEATAIVLASDWHVEEEVKRAKTSGLNRYNLDIAKARADQFFSRAVKMIQKEQQDIPIREMVLFLGGDFITGNIHEELPLSCLLEPMDAIDFAEELIASGMQFILAHTKLKVTVVCSVGNHSRITEKTYISAEQGHSLETFMYRSLRKRFVGEKRITFVIGEGYHTYIDVYGRKLRFHHGHGIRYQGGVGGLTIPVNKAISQWNKAVPAFLDCFGHYHTSMSLSNFVSNGSLIGYNAFALSIKADFERPQQSMFLVDKTRGKTVSIPLLFDV